VNLVHNAPPPGAQNPTKKKKKNKGPGNLTDTKNKTHQKKKEKKKVCAGPGNARKLPRQTDKQTNRHVTLIFF
jgi:hypothetical protein